MFHATVPRQRFTFVLCQPLCLGQKLDTFQITMPSPYVQRGARRSNFNVLGLDLSFTPGFNFIILFHLKDLKLAETTRHFWTKRTTTVSSKKTCRPKPNFLDEKNWDETYLGRNDLEPSERALPGRICSLAQFLTRGVQNLLTFLYSLTRTR